MNETNPGLLKRYSLFIYFILAYGITWVLSILATEGLLPFQIPTIIKTFSAIVLHYGPALSGIIVASIVGGKSGVCELLGRLGRWRVDFRWYLFALFFPTVISLIAVGLDFLLGGTLPKFFSSANIPEGNPLSLIIMVFLVVFFQAGLAEEIGWRGYALPKLQSRYSALVASLILGVLWGFWHFHPQNFPSLAPLAFWYMLNIISGAILLTWLYNNTDKSILLAALFHTASNVSDCVVPTLSTISATNSIRSFIIKCLLMCLVAFAVIVLYGPSHLSRRLPYKK